MPGAVRGYTREKQVQKLSSATELSRPIIFSTVDGSFS